MKIQVTITKTETIEKEITFPYFCKRDEKYLKVLENVTLEAQICGGDKNIYYLSAMPTWLKQSDIARAEECREEEFNQVANEALAYIGNNVPVPSF
jgi:hypothetical protein